MITLKEVNTQQSLIAEYHSLLKAIDFDGVREFSIKNNIPMKQDSKFKKIPCFQCGFIKEPKVIKEILSEIDYVLLEKSAKGIEEYVNQIADFFHVLYSWCRCDSVSIKYESHLLTKYKSDIEAIVERYPESNKFENIRIKREQMNEEIEKSREPFGIKKWRSAGDNPYSIASSNVIIAKHPLNDKTVSVEKFVSSVIKANPYMDQNMSSYITNEQDEFDKEIDEVRRQFRENYDIAQKAKYREKIQASYLDGLEKINSLCKKVNPISHYVYPFEHDGLSNLEIANRFFKDWDGSVEIELYSGAGEIRHDWLVEHLASIEWSLKVGCDELWTAENLAKVKQFMTLVHEELGIIHDGIRFKLIPHINVEEESIGTAGCPTRDFPINLPKNKKNDNITPKHYQFTVAGKDIQATDILKGLLTEEEYIGYLKGSYLTYLFRADRKNGLEDYEKAAKFLDWLIDFKKETQDGRE